MKKLYYTKEERICTACKILKPFSEFNWDKRFNIPFSRCKTCFNARCAAYRQSNKGKKTYRKWAMSERGKEVRTNAWITWCKKNPHKNKAGYTVSNAIRDKRLKRLPCKICGNPKSEAHHFSYDEENWLKVIWLCKKHHVQATFKKA